MLLGSPKKLIKINLVVLSHLQHFAYDKAQ